MAALLFAAAVLCFLQLALTENRSLLLPVEGISGDGTSRFSCKERPAFGDVCLVGGNISSGELLVYLSQEWSSVCREGFGYIEAQLACKQLGFPFAADIYEIQRPSSIAFEIFNYFECSTQTLATSSATLGHCESQWRNGNNTSCSSGRTTGLTCNTAQGITEDRVAIIFRGESKFAFIAPDDGIVTECTATEPFCSGIHLVDRNSQASSQIITSWNIFTSLGFIFMCSLQKPSEFGIDCNPKFGDLYLGSFSDGELELTVPSQRGELLMFDGGEWTSVCSDTFGYLEAQVACTQMGFPFFSDLYAFETPTTNASQVLAAVTCIGSESSLQNCSIQLTHFDVHSACAQKVGLSCGRPWFGSTEDSVLLVFPNKDMFTLIAPDDGYYITNCTTNRDAAFCAGVYQVDRSSSSVQSLIDHIRSGESECSSLASNPTDFGIECPIITVFDISTRTNNIIYSTSTSTVPTPTVTLLDTNRSGEGLSVGIVAGVAVGIVVVVAVILFTLILLWKHYNHRITKKVNLEDMQSGNARYTVVPQRHRTIRQRPSLKPLDDADWEIPFPCITLQEKIGSGAFGSIYRGVIACSHQPNSVEIAVKVLKKHATDSERRALLLEIDMMKDVGYHRHVVSMLGCCTSKNQLALIMEFIPHGNLQAYLREHRTSKEDCTSSIPRNIYANDLMIKPKQLDSQDQLQTKEAKRTLSVDGILSDMELIQFARQIALGMEYLASLKIVHRDLATRNVLIDHDIILKIADFGLSRDICSDPCYQMTSNDKLPVRWMSVESIVNREFTSASDVWSFGVVLWEIATYAAFPYYHMTNMEIIEKVPKGYRMSKPEQCLDEVYDIMCACWQLSPADRPSFTEILKMLDNILDTASKPLDGPGHKTLPPDLMKGDI